MEVVQRRMENMSGEIEQMRRTKLFAYNECKEILKMRKQFEYKINGITKHLQDFKDYINYEKGLLKAVRLRRNLLKIGEKMGDIEHKIISRIKGLYETTLQRFPDDTTFCLAYFQFLKGVKKVSNAASVAISNMIKNHSGVPEIWQVAAKWHAYDQNNINTALKVLRKGLAKHKTSKLLYTEVINLEIYNVAGNNDQEYDNNNELTEKQLLCLKKLEVYLKHMYAFVTEHEYFVNLVNYLDAYPFTDSLQKNIIEYLVENYSSKADIWNMLAQRERKGFCTVTNNKSAVTSSTVRLKNCINRYKGLNKISISEKDKLWSLYINCLIDSVQEDYGITKDFGANCLVEAFTEASVEGYLNEEHYLQWLELVNNDEKVQIIQTGIVKFPQSIDLWKTYLKIEIFFGDEDSIETVFKEGIKTLKEKSLPLWAGIIGYHLSNSDENTVEAYYSEGIQQSQEVSAILKPDYLEWMVGMKGIEYVRKQYISLANKKPYCKELHLTMIRLESEQTNPDFNAWDHIHKLLCEQFGNDDIDVWLNRIEYYLQHRQVSKDVIQKIYVNASNSLPETAFSDFKEKYYAMLDR